MHPSIALQEIPVESESFHDHVVRGLSLPRKRISPKYFYDERGSALFAKICELEEYYPTRTERAILAASVEAMRPLARGAEAVIEFGAGPPEKAAILLSALRPKAYVPVDISGSYLLRCGEELTRRFEDLEITAVHADFTSWSNPLTAIPLPEPRRRVGLLLGSTIGNFEPRDAEKLLAKLATWLGEGSLLIVGADLVKNWRVLHAAYNDRGGVTAQFNLNLLHRMRRELGADLDIDGFRHFSFFNAGASRVEMHIRSNRDQVIRIPGAPRPFEFLQEESMHTESSYKYSLHGFRELARRAGLEPLEFWTDSRLLFSVHALRT